MTERELLDLLKAGRDLIENAMSAHIYNADDGEEPDADCAYANYVKAVDLILSKRA